MRGWAIAKKEKNEGMNAHGMNGLGFGSVAEDGNEQVVSLTAGMERRRRVMVGW